jgi:type II secretory pathway component PulF
MMKKVVLTNVNTGRKIDVVVDTDTDDKALIGAGKAPNENAKVTSITGIDERIHRMTGKGANLDDRVKLFDGVARCLDRNISAIKSFELQANRVKSPKYKGAIAEISTKIQQGEKVSDSLGMFPELFTDEVLALVRAGEESGQLPLVCRRLANGNKKTLRIIKKLKNGMIYPVIVIILSVGVTILMSIKLVPEIKKVYAQFNSELPAITKGMIKLSDLLTTYPYLIAVPIIAVVMLFKNWGKIYAQPWMQKFLVKVPTLGNIIRKSAAAVSFRCLAMLLESNVRVNSSLKITAESASHIYYKEFFSRVQKHIEEGVMMAEAFLMESHWLGPDGRTISGILEISAETGSPTEMLNEIADDYEDELDTIANSIDKILEPITIVFLGVMVGFLIYAIYGPILNLANVVLPKKKAGQSQSSKKAN